MIYLEMTGRCENCPNASLELESMEYFSKDNKVMTEWNVKCNHQAACDRMAEALLGKYKRGEADG